MTPKIQLVFYRTVGGNEPVRDWLKTLNREDRLEVGRRLWEIRTNLPSRTIARVFICFHDGFLYVLHGFIKKVQKTPDEDLKMARNRMKEVQND